MLAAYFLSQKDYKQACTYFFNAILLRPNSAELYLQGAEMWIAQSKFEATADRAAAIKIRPGSKQAIVVIDELKVAKARVANRNVLAQSALGLLAENVWLVVLRAEGV